MSAIVVIGATSDAKPVVAAAQLAGLTIHGVYDDDSSLWGKTVLDVPVVGPIAEAAAAGLPAVIAGGTSSERRALVERLDLEWAAIIHPQAYVHPTAQIGPGTVILEGAVVQPSVKLGAHVFIDANVTVAHDCIVDDFAHLWPGVDLAGSVYVGKGANLQNGAVVIPNVTIGDDVNVGPRTVVIRDVPDFAQVDGVPARRTAATGSDPWLTVEKALAGWILTGAAMMGLGYVIARMGLFMRQLAAANEQIRMHPLHLSLWIGVMFIALGISVNLFVPIEHNRLVHRLGAQGAVLSGRWSFASILSVALAVLGVGMAAYLFDARHLGS